MTVQKVRPEGPPRELRLRAGSLSGRDNWRNWLFFALDLGLIAAAAVVFETFGPLAYPLALVLIGSRMRALANLLHEASHAKLFASRRMNDAIGQLCATVLFTRYRSYVAAHRLHHKHLWRSDADPDLPLYRATKTETGSAGRVSYRRFWTEHVLLAVCLVSPIRRIVREARVNPVRLLVPLLLGAVAATAWVAGVPGARLVTLVWFVPYFTTYQVFSYWAELGEHAALRDLGWTFGSRNWHGNVFSRWLIGSHSDDLFHLAHHLFPSVPHHRLKVLDTQCGTIWPDYAAQVRCSGFFIEDSTGPSVMRDMWRGRPDPGLRLADGSVEATAGSGTSSPARLSQHSSRVGG